VQPEGLGKLKKITSEKVALCFTNNNKMINV
jgi:hypothetical protein